MRLLRSLPPQASALRRAWTSLIRWSCREVAEQAAGSPTFLSSPHAPLPCSLTPDGLVVPGLCDTPTRSPLSITAKTPIDTSFRGSITRLQCSLRAPCVAWSASQGGSPHHHARLASGCRPGSTGWDSFTHWAAAKGFRSCLPLHNHPPSSGFVAHDAQNSAPLFLSIYEAVLLHSNSFSVRNEFHAGPQHGDAADHAGHYISARDPPLAAPQ